MLHHRLTFELDLERVRPIVKGLDRSLDPVDISRMNSGDAAVYRIGFGERKPPLVIKIYLDEPAWNPAKEAMVAGCISERSSLPVPKWLKVDETRRLLQFRYSLMTYLPGKTVRSLMSESGVETAYRQMGEMLRCLHAISMPAYGYIVANGVLKPQPTNVHYMAAAFAAVFRRFRDQGGDTGLARRLEAAVQSSFEILRHSAGAVLCHDDFHQGNVLAAIDETQALQLTGLVDFANARAGDAIFDLSKALFCSSCQDPLCQDEILAGYGHIDHPNPKGALWLYSLFHKINMWAWLTRQGRPRPLAGYPDLLRDLDEMVP